MSSLFFKYLSSNEPVEPKVFTNPGREEMPNYGWSIDEKGEEVLEVKSYTNIPEMIQSQHDSVALPLLIKRFMDGDEKALSGSKAHAFYDDITQLPSNMHDAHRLMVEMRDQFDSLPYEDRAFFNNDFNQFIASVGNGNFLKFMETKLNKDIDGDGVIGDGDSDSNVKDGDVNE